MRKTIYLIGAIAGTVVPYYFLIQFLMQYGFDLPLFVQQMFANPIAILFVLDLFISSFVFCMPRGGGWEWAICGFLWCLT
jgi:hypothetical protein